MKKLLARSSIVLLVSATVMQASGEIRHSHHDFSAAGWSGGELCIVCHTPHGADTTVPDAPLWNHELSTASYIVYSSATLDAVPSQPNGVSKLCLSCHDGTVAVDSYGGSTRSRFAGFGNIGTDLSRHHPISFIYDTPLASADGGLRDPASTPSGLGGTISRDLLRDDKMECTSCHDVHISRNTAGCAGCHSLHGGTTTQTLSLWKSNERSALCLTCHDK